LRKRNKEKVEVEEELELLVKHEWEEGYWIVLLVPNEIAREAPL